MIVVEESCYSSWLFSLLLLICTMKDYTEICLLFGIITCIVCEIIVSQHVLQQFHGCINENPFSYVHIIVEDIVLSGPVSDDPGTHLDGDIPELWSSDCLPVDTHRLLPLSHRSVL